MWLDVVQVSTLVAPQLDLPAGSSSLPPDAANIDAAAADAPGDTLGPPDGDPSRFVAPATAALPPPPSSHDAVPTGAAPSASALAPGALIGEAMQAADALLTFCHALAIGAPAMFPPATMFAARDLAAGRARAARIRGLVAARFGADAAAGAGEAAAKSVAAAPLSGAAKGGKAAAGSAAAAGGAPRATTGDASKAADDEIQAPNALLGAYMALELLELDGPAPTLADCVDDGNRGDLVRLPVSSRSTPAAPQSPLTCSVPRDCLLFLAGPPIFLSCFDAQRPSRASATAPRCGRPLPMPPSVTVLPALRWPARAPSPTRRHPRHRPSPRPHPRRPAPPPTLCTCSLRTLPSRRLWQTALRAPWPSYQWCALATARHWDASPRGRLHWRWCARVSTHLRPCVRASTPSTSFHGLRRSVAGQTGVVIVG